MTSAGERLAKIDPLGLGAAVAIAVGTVLRASIGSDQPLWLEETFPGG